VADPLSSPVPLDGVVSDEKLSYLLGLGTEYPELDFKGKLDLAKKRDQVELAKHIGAMQVKRGYIVVGAKSNGLLTGALDDEDLSRFDEAKLTPMMLKWLPEPLELRVRVTEREDHKVVLVYVGGHPSGCAFFRADGKYKGDDGQEVTAFLERDVFWREGTRSVRMNQHGLEEVIRNRVDDAKRAWMDEQRVLRRRERDEYEAATKGSGPLGSVNLDLDQTALNAGVLELVRREDEIALEYLLNEAVNRARDLISHGEVDAVLSDLLDRLTCVSAAFLNYGLDGPLARVVETLTQIYSMPVNEGDDDRFAYSTSIDPSEPAPRIWLQIIERVYALGALAVRRENWDAVRLLTLQMPRRVDDFEKNWLRHTITRAARAQHFYEQKGGETLEVSLLNMAREDVVRLGCLREDGVGPDDDQVLTSLAQFDALSNIVAIDGAGEARRSYFYPNFARFYSSRSIPIVERLLIDQDMRQALFRGNDRSLAVALKVIGDGASHEGFRFRGFNGWGPEIDRFVAANPPQPT
jgi:hypothetical protein